MRLVVAAAISLHLTVAVQAASVAVTWKCRNDVRCGVRGSVVVRSVADASLEKRLPIESPSVVIDGVPGSEWDLTLEANGFWASPLRLSIPPASQQTQWDVWRTGRIRFSLRSPDGVPDGARIVVASPPDPRKPPDIAPETYFDCVADEDARWNCDVPATLLDLSVRGKGGYTPHYRWDVDLSSEGVLDFGTIDLRRGASVLAWLDVDFLKRMQQQPVRASIRHQAAADASVVSVRLAAPLAEAVFTKKGFVQLSPLAAGRYVVDVQAKGFVPVRIPVETHEGRESVLRRPIELAPAASLRLRLIPPMGPEDAPWHVDLIRRVDFGTG
jgi:hypothetical protein